MKRELAAALLIGTFSLIGFAGCGEETAPPAEKPATTPAETPAPDASKPAEEAK